MATFNDASRSTQPTATVTPEIVLRNVRKLLETDVQNFMEGYIKHILSKEKAAV